MLRVMVGKPDEGRAKLRLSRGFQRDSTLGRDPIESSSEPTTARDSWKAGDAGNECCESCTPLGRVRSVEVS